MAWSCIISRRKWLLWNEDLWSLFINFWNSWNTVLFPNISPTECKKFELDKLFTMKTIKKPYLTSWKPRSKRIPWLNLFMKMPRLDGRTPRPSNIGWRYFSLRILLNPPFIFKYNPISIWMRNKWPISLDINPFCPTWWRWCNKKYMIKLRNVNQGPFGAP